MVTRIQTSYLIIALQISTFLKLSNLFRLSFDQICDKFDICTADFAIRIFNQLAQLKAPFCDSVRNDGEPWLCLDQGSAKK